MNYFDHAANVARQVAEPAPPHTSTSSNRWVRMEAGFRRLLTVAPPLQVHRVTTLHEMASRFDYIEEAEYLLGVATELVRLQTALDAALYDDDDASA